MKPKCMDLNDSRGFILITSYILISALSVASFAMFSRGNSFLQATERNQSKLAAFNMAEAALDMALVQLNNDPTYEGTGGYVSMDAANFRGGYEITVTTPDENPNVRMVEVSGFSPGSDSTERAYETRSVTAYVEMEEEGLFNFAVFADENIQLNGNARVDSYDSRLGAYGGANQADNGDIGTNGTGSGNVSLTGNAIVQGDAQVGPGGNPNTVITTSGNARVEGDSSAATAEQVYPAPTTGAVSLGSLSISGNNNYSLAAGTYRFSSLSISGNGRLTPLGPVTLYIDGSVKIAGNGVATTDNLPPNFIIYVTGNDTVQLSGNGNFYGGIYAPNSSVKNTGNGQLFGAIVADTYQQSGNGMVHYDEALSTVGGSSGGGFNLKSWRENNTAAWGTGTTSYSTPSHTAYS